MKQWHAVVVAIVKDEARTIENWLLYHLALGFEHFFIYDNGSADGTARVLDKFVAGGVATCINWPVRAGQIDAYNHALMLLRGASEWIGFLDVDEYVVLHDHADIGAYLDACSADQVLLPWRNFLHGGHSLPPGGTDIENYCWALKVQQAGAIQVKHLVRSTKALHVTAHFSRLSAGDTILADGTAARPTHVVTGPSYRGAQINHYATRSYAENLARWQKGQVNGGAEKQLAGFHPLTAESRAQLDYDASILRHFRAFAQERQRWAAVSAAPHRFGLMQRAAVLSSWNNLPFFFAKSYANYLLGLREIAHGTTLDLVSTDPAGNARRLSTFWHNAELRSVHFGVDEQGCIPFFVGSIHYGDFVRRFGFEARVLERAFAVPPGWACALDYAGECFAAIFDVDSGTGAEITVATGDTPVAQARLPVGRHAGLIYHPAYIRDRASFSVRISGTCRVRELIVGALP